MDTCEPLHLMQGTPALCAMIEDPTLSPSAYMALAAGPRNTIFCLVFASLVGREGFSEACPQPAQTASTSFRVAMSTIRSTFA